MCVRTENLKCRRVMSKRIGKNEFWLSRYIIAFASIKIRFYKILKKLDSLVTEIYHS